MTTKSGSKVYADAASALRGVVRDGMTLMCGGFGACGIPENLIDALHASGVGNLTVVSNNAGLDGVGLGLLLQTRQIRKMISSYVGEGKETRTVDGETYVLEKGLVADVSLVKAWKGDTEGNLVYRKTARNFNPNMATAARITVAEVEELVETGTLDPDCIHTPGIFVQRIIQGARYTKLIEKRTVRKRGENSNAVVA